MNQASAEEVLKEIAPDGELLRFESLAGGISAQTFRLDYSVARQTHSVVVSVHSDVDWQRNPNLAADEFEVLTFLLANGYPVASPIYVGTDSGIFDRPYLVVEHLGVDEEKVTENASFIDDLGADSLDTVELVMAFEEEFDIEIPDDAAEHIQKVGDAVKFISEKVG